MIGIEKMRKQFRRREKNNLLKAADEMWDYE